MKHLKSFNEGISWNKDREEILKFCEDHLAYLTDDGFNISVRLYEMNNLSYKGGIRDEGYISISNSKYLFKWNDIKYDFVPFLNELVKKYNLLNTSYKNLNVIFYHDTDGKSRTFTSNKYNENENIDKLLLGTLRSSKIINQIKIIFE